MKWQSLLTLTLLLVIGWGVSPGVSALNSSFDSRQFQSKILENGEATIGRYPIQAPGGANGETPLTIVDQIGGSVNSIALPADGVYAYVAQGARLVILDISDSSNPRKIGETSVLRGSINRVAVIDDRAYLAAGYGGLLIIDVSDPAAPVELGSFAEVNSAQDVVVHDLYAYLADYETGLYVVDVSNPAMPSAVYHLPLIGGASSIEVAGNYAYLGESFKWINGVPQGGSLQIYDLSSPASPALISSLEMNGEKWTIRVKDEYVYVAGGSRGLVIVDVADPANPLIIAQLSISPQGIALVDNLALVADTNNGLQVVDITFPADPRLVATVETEDSAMDVVVLDDLAYVADRDGGLYLIDYRGLYPVGRYQPPSPGTSIIIQDELAYITHGASGFTVLDISDMPHPREIKQYGTPGTARYLDVVDGLAYVADYQAGLQIIDLQTGDLIGASATSKEAIFVQVSGDYAYVLGRSGYANAILDIIDISVPQTPTRVSASGVGPAKEFIMRDNMIFVASSPLRLIDVSDPAHPMQIASYTPMGEGYAVAMAGNLLAFGGTRGTILLDASEPSNLIEIARLSTAARHLEFENGRLFVICQELACHSGSLVIIDLSDPSNPEEIMTNRSYVYGDLAVTATHAFILDDTYYVPGDYLYIIDIAHLAGPQARGRYVTEVGRVSDFVIADNHAFVASFDGTLRIFDVADPLAWREIIRLQYNRFISQLALSGELLLGYVDNRSPLLVILDVATPSDPVEVARYDLEGRVYRINIVQTSTRSGVQQTLAYLAAGQDGLIILDVSNPVQPVAVSTTLLSDSVLNVAVVGNYAYLVVYDPLDRSHNLHVLDVSNPASPVQIGFFDSEDAAYDMTAVDHFLFTADSSGGMSVFDSSIPEMLTPIVKWGMPRSSHGITVIGQYLYLSSRYNLTIFDISNPGRPELVAWRSTPDSISAIAWLSRAVQSSPASEAFSSLLVGANGYSTGGVLVMYFDPSIPLCEYRQLFPLIAQTDPETR